MSYNVIVVKYYDGRKWVISKPFFVCFHCFVALSQRAWKLQWFTSETINLNSISVPECGQQPMNNLSKQNRKIRPTDWECSGIRWLRSISEPCHKCCSRYFPPRVQTDQDFTFKLTYQCWDPDDSSNKRVEFKLVLEEKNQTIFLFFTWNVSAVCMLFWMSVHQRA